MILDFKINQAFGTAYLETNKNNSQEILDTIVQVSLIYLFLKPCDNATKLIRD